jgi:carbonic anhydrase
MPLPQQLIDGYRAFLIGRLRHEQDRYRDLAESGQSPQIMVIVPPYAPDERAHGVSAALEFGVGALKVKHIVVLGHAQCGGVKAYAEDAEPLSPGDFIGNWMKLLTPAAEKLGPRDAMSPAEYLTRLEQANVINSIDNLMTFPRLRSLVESGRVAIHGAYFGVATGQLSVRDPATGKFSQIAAEDYARMFAQPRF